MIKQNLILIGGGGHCKSCIDVIESSNQYEIKGILDLESNLGKTILGYTTIGIDNDIPFFVKKKYHFLISLGAISDPSKRIELFNLVISFGGIFPIIISPNAYVSRHAKIGIGTIIMHHAMINASAIVGRNCIINSKALIEHDTIIGDHCHISTGSIVNGGTNVGARSFFGSGAVSKQYINIPENSFIKANSIVK